MKTNSTKYVTMMITRDWFKNTETLLTGEFATIRIHQKSQEIFCRSETLFPTKIAILLPLLPRYVHRGHLRGLSLHDDPGDRQLRSVRFRNRPHHRRPLASLRNAEFMKAEVPGVVVPDPVMARMLLVEFVSPIILLEA